MHWVNCGQRKCCESVAEWTAHSIEADGAWLRIPMSAKAMHRANAFSLFRYEMVDNGMQLGMIGGQCQGNANEGRLTVPPMIEHSASARYGRQSKLAIVFLQYQLATTFLSEDGFDQVSSISSKHPSL